MQDIYDEIFKNSIKHPNKFWEKEAQKCFWYKPWNKVLNENNKPLYKWFTGGITNTCYNALDLHINNGKGNNTAIIYDSPVTNIIKKYSYLQLYEKVRKFSGVLVKNQIKKGDTIIIYMPMIPETVIAMLSCARIGAIHSVVFGGFASEELAARIDDAKPKIIISASCGIEVKKIIEYKPLLDKAISISKHKPNKSIIFQRSIKKANMIKGRDIDWISALDEAKSQECVKINSTDPLYILYTSGTTGKPKGIVRDNGGHLVALKWSMKAIYNINEKDVFWAASDVGWVVGHSYIVYAPLFKGACSIIFEGKPVNTPDAGTFWRVISEHKVKTLFTAPTALRAIKREDPKAKLIKNYDLSSFKSLFLAGERSDSNTIQWLEKHLDIPIIDHWWQTETGWPITANCMGIKKFPIKYGSSTKPVPGWNLKVLNPEGKNKKINKMGEFAIKLPLPPGSLLTLWNNEKEYLKSYLNDFPGYYKTSDAGYIDKDGYVYIMSRTDDIINIAGHRISTGIIEEILSNHNDVAECAVIGVEDKIKGQIPLGLIILNNEVIKNNKEIKKELVEMIRNKIGPVAFFKLTIIVKRLPKTRSGKILRNIIKKIADNKKYTIPPTIDNPEILIEIEKKLIEIGYSKSRS